MKPDTQPQQKPGLSEPGGRSENKQAVRRVTNTATPPNKPGQYEESTGAPDQTAEPDGQFPENPRGTLDDHQAGEDPVRGNDPNGEDVSLAADPEGTKKVSGLRRDAGTTRRRGDG